MEAAEGMAEGMRDPNTDPPHEKAIQNLIADGKHKKAVEKAFEAYGGEIKAYLVNSLSGYLHEYVAEGEDLAADVFVEFLKIIKKPPAIGYSPSKGRVRTFLFGIARNLVRKRLRTLGRSMRNVNAAWSSIDPRNLKATHVRDLEATLLEEERIRKLNQAMERLPSVYREIIILFYYHKHKTADIAHIIGKDKADVRKRLSKARAKLREEITDDE
jgi:RNA polymerase sigma-70 factor (ECF subfamily)